jgi:conjugal transfer pilus assembly protein TraL
MGMLRVTSSLFKWGRAIKRGAPVKPIRMPRDLDDQMYILFWSADELLPGLAVFIVGVLVNQKSVCLLISIVATKLFRKLKEGSQDGYLIHVAYWWGLIGAGRSYSMPNPFIREFVP